MGTVVRAILWLCLGGWIGALALFAFGVAPTAFRVLPSPEVAGQMVGPLLMGLNLYGIAAGVALSGLAWWMGRGWLLMALPLLMALVCAVSEFGVTAAISQVRPGAFGPDSQAEAAAHFSQLHRTSRFFYDVVMGGAFALVLLHARADTRKLS